MQEKFEDPVIEKDLILVYVDEKPAFFARVEGFTPDHKPNWWQVKLLVLQVPPKVITWILRQPQINGEPFTMGGTPVRIEKVRVHAEEPAKLSVATGETDITPAEAPEPTPVDVSPARQARILSLENREKPAQGGE